MCVGRITGIVVTDETTPDRWLRVQLTRKFNELPGTMKSKERYQNSQNNNEIWLEEIRTTIRIQDVVRHTTVWIKNNSVDTSTPLIFEFSIQEIIYNFNGRQKLRSVFLQHELPVEYIIDPQPPPNQHIKHLKFL